MIKSWLIKVAAPICGTDTYYCAFSEGDPLDNPDFPYDETVNDLWDDYSWLLHLEAEEYESEEEREEAYNQAYEDWKCDCSFESEEMSLEEIQDYMPGGTTPEENIIYDERG